MFEKVDTFLKEFDIKPYRRNTRILRNNIKGRFQLERLSKDYQTIEKGHIKVCDQCALDAFLNKLIDYHKNELIKINKDKIKAEKDYIKNEIYILKEKLDNPDEDKKALKREIKKLENQLL